MANFQVWLESLLQRQQRQQIQNLYDLTVKQLLGAATDQIQLNLSDISDETATGNTPPSQKGPASVIKKLTAIHLFDKLKAVGNVDLQRRVDGVQNWLQQMAHTPQGGPKGTVGELLNRLFGDNATEIYGKRNWEKEPMPKPSQPQTPRLPPQQPPGNALPQPQVSNMPPMPSAGNAMPPSYVGNGMPSPMGF